MTSLMGLEWQSRRDHTTRQISRGRFIIKGEGHRSNLWEREERKWGQGDCYFYWGHGACAKGHVRHRVSPLVLWSPPKAGCKDA